MLINRGDSNPNAKRTSEVRAVISGLREPDNKSNDEISLQTLFRIIKEYRLHNGLLIKYFKKKFGYRYLSEITSYKTFKDLPVNDIMKLKQVQNDLRENKIQPDTYVWAEIVAYTLNYGKEDNICLMGDDGYQFNISELLKRMSNPTMILEKAIEILERPFKDCQVYFIKGTMTTAIVDGKISTDTSINDLEYGSWNGTRFALVERLVKVLDEGIDEPHYDRYNLHMLFLKAKQEISEDIIDEMLSSGSIGKLKLDQHMMSLKVEDLRKQYSDMVNKMYDQERVILDLIDDNNKYKEAEKNKASNRFKVKLKRFWNKYMCEIFIVSLVTFVFLTGRKFL